MGEAKRRKESDPNYGRFSSKMRGLVLSLPVEIDGTSTRIKSGNLDAQDLRSSLLYWDRLTLPTSNIIYIPGGPDADYLVSCGILHRRHYEVFGDGAQGLIKTQTLALEDLEKEAPGVWSLGAGENSLLIKRGVAIAEQGALIKLYNALPIPKENTPLAEILEFRAKRRSELLAFRTYMEELSHEISNSSDRIDELNKKLKLLDVSCSDLIKLTKEHQLPVYLSNLNASLNVDLTKIAATAVGVWKGAVALGFEVTTATVAAITSAAATTFSLKADIKLRPINRPSSPFKYVYLAQRDLG
ncbi:hypothetical protein EDF80_105268 [Pseudomonas brenneri]|nr:hypothetical protein EDF80_105268 [Pseudomonas brenneri]